MDFGYTSGDRIRDKVIQDKVGVAFVMDKMREASLKWSGHVKRKCAVGKDNKVFPDFL